MTSLYDDIRSPFLSVQTRHDDAAVVQRIAEHNTIRVKGCIANSRRYFRVHKPIVVTNAAQNVSFDVVRR